MNSAARVNAELLMRVATKLRDQGTPDEIEAAERIEAWWRRDFADLNEAFGLKLSAGQRDPRSREVSVKYDQIILDARRRFLPEMSDPKAAKEFRRQLKLYQEASWMRRDRGSSELPLRLRGKINAAFWEMLKLRDCLPTELALRKKFNRGRWAATEKGGVSGPENQSIMSTDRGEKIS